MRRLMCLLALMVVVAACDQLKMEVVPRTGDTAQDAAAAQSHLPNFSNYGYTSTNARSITDALAAVGGSAALLTGNPALAAGIAKIDDMIRCYESVGAVAANIYARADVIELAQGQIPSVGALAIINRDRIQRNLLQCALNTGQGFAAQSADVIQPCGGAGTIVRNNETLDFVYAATDPQLCTLFQAAMQ